MQKPEFNDQYVKSKIREHKKFGGKVVEFLYGAKDADGNPTAPAEGKDDGHGRWYGIEVNGDYRMFVWNHSRDEGGAVEYGTPYKEDGITVMEEQLQKKWDLVREAELIARNVETEAEGDRIAEIRREYDALTDWNTPVEKAKDGYDARLKAAEEELEPRLAALKANREQKEAVVAKADALKDASNFRDARNEVAKLKAELGEIGSAGVKADAEFRRSLNDVDHLLREKQKEYLENRDANFAKAETAKREIIEKTRAAVANVKNYKQTGDALNSLFDEWKAAGSAGHNTDEELWQEFNGLRKEFFTARNKFMDERKEAFGKAAEAKKKLIEQAKELSAQNDFSKKVTDQMKQLDVEWKAAGSAGRRTDDALWKEFNDAKEIFWNGKQEQFKKMLQGDIDRKQEELDALNRMNEDLEYRAEIAPTPAMRDDSERQLSINHDRAVRLQNEIDSLKKRIGE